MSAMITVKICSPRLLKGASLCLALAALLVIAGAAAPLGAADPADPFARVVERQLPNGLKVLLLKESRAPLITLQLWFKVGSRNEELGKTGLSHLTEHLMFKGTEKYGQKFFSREVQKAGGSDNAFTSRDYTAFFENGPQTQLKRWLEMEADRLRGLKVSETDFATERKVVLEERRRRTEDDPVSFLVEQVLSAAFTAHPYQWPVIGWLHDIENLTHQDFLSYYQRYYQPNNCTLVVAGDIDPDAAFKDIEAVFGAIPKGPEPPKVTAKEPRQFGERRLAVRREAQLPFIYMVYHAPNWEEQDAYPLEVLSRILSQGRSSRLYHRLVYQQRLALEAGADYNFDTANPTLFAVHGQPMPGKDVKQLEEALDAEISRMQKELVSDAELAKVRNQIQASFYMGLDSLFYRGMLLGRLDTVAPGPCSRSSFPIS